MSPGELSHAVLAVVSGPWQVGCSEMAVTSWLRQVVHSVGEHKSICVFGLIQPFGYVKVCKSSISASSFPMEGKRKGHAHLEGSWLFTIIVASVQGLFCLFVLKNCYVIKPKKKRNCLLVTCSLEELACSHLGIMSWKVELGLLVWWTQVPIVAGQDEQSSCWTATEGWDPSWKKLSWILIHQIPEGIHSNQCERTFLIFEWRIPEE